MKQLLIVNSAKNLNASGATPKDLSGLQAGSLTFFIPGAASPISNVKPTTNYGIALGRANSTPIVIPEVDVDTLTVTKATPDAGAKYKASITIPTPADGLNYTLQIIKLGAKFNERNQWTATTFVPAGVTKTAAQVAKTLAAGLAGVSEADFTSGMTSARVPVTVTLSSATITIEAVNKGIEYKLAAGDDLYGTAITLVTAAKPVIGDKKYIEELASKCAAGKGFTDTYQDGDSIYPGYPETVEDTTYNVYTLRFATGRKSAKQRDERVWQTVHIAVPVGNTDVINKGEVILGLAEPSNG